LDHRPSVFALPAGLAVRAGAGEALLAQGTLWCRVGAQWAAVPAPEPEDPWAALVADDERAIVAQTRSGAAFVVQGGAASWHRGVRAGSDTQLRATRMGWDDPAAPLPEGGARTARAWPWLLGSGVTWADAGYVYRKPVGRPARALASIGPTHDLRVGPGGAYLIAEEDGGLSRGGAPGCAAVALQGGPPALAALAWAGDGRSVGFLDAEGIEHRLDLTTGACVETTSAPDSALPRGAGAWALRDHQLAGPGRRLWDLRSGAALGAPDLIGDGATVWVRKTGLYATASSNGSGAWIDERGAQVGSFTLPCEDARVLDAGAEGRSALFVLTDGRVWAVEGDSVKRSRRDVDSDAPDLEDPPDLAAALALPHAARVDGRLWAWSDEGALVSLP
jgi:hypothetical protein